MAKFRKENCVVYADNTACGACSEHSPTKAVNMVPYPNPLDKLLKIPGNEAGIRHRLRRMPTMEQTTPTHIPAAHCAARRIAEAMI